MFCGSCVTKLPVYRMNYVDPAFVCKKCESTCTAEADFYEHHLKVLCKGEMYINNTTQVYKNGLNYHIVLYIQVQSFAYQTQKILKKLTNVP